MMMDPNADPFAAAPPLLKRFPLSLEQVMFRNLNWVQL
jgi:hypothetical protein